MVDVWLYALGFGSVLCDGFGIFGCCEFGILSGVIWREEDGFGELYSIDMILKKIIDEWSRDFFLDRTKGLEEARKKTILMGYFGQVTGELVERLKDNERASARSVLEGISKQFGEESEKKYVLKESMKRRKSEGDIGTQLIVYKKKALICSRCGNMGHCS